MIILLQEPRRQRCWDNKGETQGQRDDLNESTSPKVGNMMEALRVRRKDQMQSTVYKDSRSD